MSNRIETLVARAEELEARLKKIKKDVTAPHSADSSEQAQERENDEVLDGIALTTEEELKLVYRALNRNQAGEYGICEKCHSKIDDKRLDAIPEAEYCIRCAA